MKTRTLLGRLVLWTLVGVAAIGAPAVAQVGSGLLDFNTASVEELAALPHLNEQQAKLVKNERPFASIVELNEYLLKQGLSAEHAEEIYRSAFVHVNLNTGSQQEILLIPGAGRRMAHEFDEYRPWKSWKHFDREIGKYVDQTEVDRLKQYVFVPIKLNGATDEEIGSIPGVGRRMIHEFKEYRPWKSQAHFEREIGKYVDDAEVARLWRYVTIDAAGE